MSSYDCIVIGLGGMGSAACWRLARRGLSVLGLDRHPIAHDRGSSHGQTRIIRKAYFEHPDYVPLLQRAYALWEELEHETGQPGKLLHRVGLLLAGAPQGPVLSGCRRSADLHRLELHTLTADDVAARFPGLAMADSMQALLEPEAGYLRVEDCVAAMAELAGRSGADLRPLEGVRHWSAAPGGVRVTTDAAVHRADRLVVCGGPWSGQLLPEVRHLLEVRRKVQLWYEAPDDLYRGLPVYGFETPAGFFYGFPKLDAGGVKVGEHSGGQTVADPSMLRRDLHDDDQVRVRDFLTEHLPGAGPMLTRHSVCMYTMSPDEHFIIDRLEHPSQVSFAAGFSGHGFKFARVVGEVLADLATAGGTPLPVNFLSARRFRETRV